MKLSLVLEGSEDEIVDFMFALVPDSLTKESSVPPEPAAASSLEDRKPNALEEFMAERAKLKKKPDDSVPKAPVIKERDHDRKISGLWDKIPKLPTKEDLLIPRFEWKRECEKNYNKLLFAELPDGRVMLSYMSAKVFTTKEKVLQIPFPVPPGYLKKCGAPNNVTALLQYRKYLAGHSVPPGNIRSGDIADRKEEKDPDEAFRPKLKGAFSTRPGKEDIDQLGGSEA